MNFKRVTISLFLLTVLLVNCSKDDNPEKFAFSITALSPDSGPEGTIVELTGVGFSPASVDNLVRFNGVVASVIDASETMITVKVPIGATTGRVSVTRNSETVEGPVFTVTMDLIKLYP